MADRSGDRRAVYGGERDDSARRAEELLNVVDDGIYRLDAGGRFVAVNDAMVETTGHERETLLDSHFSLVVDDEGTARVDAAVDAARESEDDVRVTVSIRTAGGAVRPAEVTITPVFREGEFHGSAGVVRVSEDPDEERTPAFESSDQGHDSLAQRYESLVDAVEEYAIFTLDSDGRVETWNDGAERLAGYAADEVVDEHVSTFYTEADRASNAPARDLRTAAERGRIQSEGLRVRADGSVFWARASLSAIFEDDELAGYVLITRDMTERREYERELRRERSLIDRMFEMAPVGIGIFGPDGNLQRANDRVSTLLGLDDAADVEAYVSGDVRSFDEDGDLLATEEFPVRQALATGDPVFDRELRMEYDDGNSRWASVNAAPITDADGVRYVVATMSDITQLKAQTDRLERQRDELEAELDEVFDRISDGFYGLDENLRFTYVNDRTEAILGLSESSAVGAAIDEELELTDAFESALRQALDDQHPVYLEDYYEPVDGWFENAMYPSESGLSVYFRDVTDRKHSERELEAQRERLAALDHLNGVVRDVTDAAIDQSTREEIEQVVCDGLVAADGYEFAWIGDADTMDDGITCRAKAGIENGSEALTTLTGAGDPRSWGPVTRAIKTGEIQVDDGPYGPFEGPTPGGVTWAEHVEKHGFESCVSIPITYEEVSYGVLNVYSARKAAFEGEEREVIGQLGEQVGHAIAAVQRKRALMSDQLTELEFKIPDVFAALGVPVDGDEPITLDEAIPVTDDDYLLYGTTTARGMDTVDAFVESLPHWTSVRVVSETDAQCTFEARLSEPPVLSAVAARGGSVDAAEIEDRCLTMCIHVPAGVEVRQLIEVVDDAYPSVEFVSQRQITRESVDPQDALVAFETALTDRQQAALRTAYHAGFFEWPRESSGEEVATAIGVTSPTFSQHLRAAQSKVFRALFEPGTVEE